MQSVRKVFHYIPAAIAVMIFILSVSPISAMAAEKKKKFVVVIDAGHGGSDHGAIENGINEKDVTLAVALKLGALIKKKLKDTEVVYTRSTDQFISLQRRAEISNNAKADLFVSVHCNSVDRSNKNRANVVGATTYVLGHHKDEDNLAVAKRENAVVELDGDDSTHFSEFDPQSDESNIIYQMSQKKNFQNSIRFAVDVQREMQGIGRVSRGVQQAGFWVLWSTAAPAALIELDFLCNPEQARFLNSKDGQDKLAGAIFNAVKKYENYFRASLGTAGVSPNTNDKASEEAPAAVEIAMTDYDQATETPKAGGSSELTSATGRRDRKAHRAETAQVKKSTDGSHRRRSSSAREAGASQVEQAEILMSEEVTYGLEFADASEAKEKTQPEPARDTKSVKKNSKKEEKKADKTTKPGRRDRQSGRKGRKQSVNVDYRVLLFVSDDELKAGDEAFKGLTPVASFRENNKFKYTYGESADRKEMELLLSEISPLFPDARVIKCYY